MSDFMQRIRGSAGRVSFEADKQRRVLAIQNDLRKLKKQAEEEYEGIGRKAVELFGEGQIKNEELGAACEGVASLQTQIAEMEAEIEAIKVEEYQPPVEETGRMCPECQVSLPAEAGFCPNCGSEAVDVVPPEPEPPEPEAEAEPAPVCAECGAEIDPEAAFCSNCGAKQGEAEE